MVTFTIWAGILIFIIFAISNIVVPIFSGGELFWIFNRKKKDSEKDLKLRSPNEKLKDSLIKFEEAKNNLKNTMKEVAGDKSEAERILSEAKMVEEEGSKLLEKFEK